MQQHESLIMAYMNQEKKVKIAAALKKVVPADWKYTLGVDNHSTIVMTITSAPVNLLAKAQANSEYVKDNFQVNQFYPEKSFDGRTLETVMKILDALNLNNHDNSDIMTDYFDVGHYVNLNIGRWNKPFVCTSLFAEA